MCISYGTALLNWKKCSQVIVIAWDLLGFQFLGKNTGNHKNRFTWLNQRDWIVYRFYHDASEILPVRGLIWRSMNDAKIRPDLICVVRCRVQNSGGYFCLFFFTSAGTGTKFPYVISVTIMGWHVLNRQLRSLKNGARSVLNMQKYAVGQICGENLQVSSRLCGSRVTVHLELNIVQSLSGIRQRWSINNFCLHWPWPAICTNYLTNEHILAIEKQWNKNPKPCSDSSLNDSSVKVDRLDYNLRL